MKRNWDNHTNIVLAFSRAKIASLVGFQSVGGEATIYTFSYPEPAICLVNGGIADVIQIKPRSSGDENAIYEPF